MGYTSLRGEARRTSMEMMSEKYNNVAKEVGYVCIKIVGINLLIWFPQVIIPVFIVSGWELPVWFIFVAGLVCKAQNFFQAYIFFSTPSIYKKSKGFFYGRLEKQF